jgi:putative ABC transport system permease protein
MRFLQTGSRIAWRELKASPSRFLFIVIAVAVGVGALSGVKGFGSAFRSMLFRNAKQLTASDLSAQVYATPDADQLRRLYGIGRRVGNLTWVTETVSMASGASGPPQMVAVKAVDPAAYPFYGKLAISSSRPLSQALTNSSLLVNQELLIRLHMRAGDTLRLGGQEFRIAGVVLTEPDRLASGFGPSMRVMMSRQALDRTGLMQAGSRASQRFLFRFNPDVNIDRLKDELKGVLVRPRITDFRDGDPAIERGINNSTTFLSLVSLIALIVGSLGVGMAMYSHLQQKMDIIAVMKAVGARSRQVMTIYLIQTMWLGLAGGLIGIAIGAVVQKAFPVLIHQVFDFLPEVSWDWSFSLQGLALGMIATLLFTMPPLIGIREIRPSQVFRRDMQEPNGRAAWRSVPYVLSLAAIIASFVGIAVWLCGSWLVAAYFIGGLSASLLLLTAIASLLLRAMRFTVKKAGRSLPASFRHGFANLYRPGTHAASVLVALGVGVMFTYTTYLVQQTILRNIHAEAPAQSGNVFLLDIRPDQREQVAQFVAAQPGVKRSPELIGYFVARIVEKNGTSVQNLPLTKQQKDQMQTSRLSVVSIFPKNFELTAGHFWPERTDQPQVLISESEGRRYGLRTGDRLKFQAAGRFIVAPVVGEYRPTSRSAFRFEILFPRDAMHGVPAIYFGAAQVEAARIPQLEEGMFERFPTVSVMNLADILQRVQEAVDQVALVIRFLAGFAILAGVIVLSSSIAGTRQRRLREVAIFKTLGAVKRRIMTVFSIEFTILGLVAGLIGALLANAFTAVIAKRFIEAPFVFEWGSLLIATVGTALLANAAGWLASMKILDLRPLEVLRSE